MRMFKLKDEYIDTGFRNVMIFAIINEEDERFIEEN